MEFERGKDPKQTLRIGIVERSLEVIKRLISENVLDLANQEIHRKIEESFKKEIGLEMRVKIDMDREGIHFEIYRPIYDNKIEKITIRPFQRDWFINTIEKKICNSKEA